ncbi:MAG: hypothetical protein AB7K24_10755 [Gemmataceae bacterium]
MVVPVNRFWRDARRRFTFEMYRVPADCYPAICKDLMEAFGLTVQGRLVDGWDVVFQEYSCGLQFVELAWDNWSGFFVTSKSSDADSLVRELGFWLLQSKWTTVVDKVFL